MGPLGLLEFAWNNKYGRIAMEVVAVAAVLFFVVRHFVEVGKEQGRDEQKQVEVKHVNQDVVTGKEDLAKELQDANTRADTATKAATKAQKDAQDSLDKVKQIQQSMSDIAAKLDAVRDVDLHAYNVQQMGLRPATEVNACYDAGEERQIGKALGQWPQCEKLSAAKDGTIDALNHQVAANTEGAAAAASKEASHVRYETLLEGSVTRLIELYPPKKRGMKCLGLWKCAKDMQKIPTLAQLQAQAGAK